MSNAIYLQSPPDRHPNDKYPVNTSHRSPIVQKWFTAVLFGSSGNSYTVSTQSDCTYIYTYSSQYRSDGRAVEIKYWDSSECGVP